MKLLVLGGTKNLGRHVVEAALADGHQVTLFNRGLTNPGLFGDVRRIAGDRAAPDALAAGEWDGVIDMSGFLVRDVALSASILRDHCDHYTYMSSIAVYASKTTPGMTETAPLLPWPADTRVAPGPGVILVARLAQEWGRYRTPEGEAAYFTLNLESS